MLHTAFLFVYSQAQHDQLSSGHLSSSALADYLDVDQLLLGLSRLTCHLFDLVLLHRPALPNEVWSSGIRVLTVIHKEQGPVGTIYIDLQHRYGTRMLRYSRTETTLAPGDSMQQNANATVKSEFNTNGRQTDSNSSCKNGRDADRDWDIDRMYAYAVMQCNNAGDAQAGHLSAALPKALAEALINNCSSLPAVSIGVRGVPATRNGSKVDSADSSTPGQRSHLTVSSLWELVHELGHALHMVMSSRSADAIPKFNDGSTAVLGKVVCLQPCGLVHVNMQRLPQFKYFAYNAEAHKPDDKQSHVNVRVTHM